jgi:hypothetical protein
MARSPLADTTPPPPDSSWVRVPLGPEADRWTTVKARRTVLVVLRTVTTLWWLLDMIAEAIGDDPRIQILFTVAEGSAFEAGVADTVVAVGGRLVPWEQAVSEKFDLAICASHYGALNRLNCSLLMTTHGPGYNKRIALFPDRMPPLPASATPGVPDTTIVLSHDSQREHWQDGPRQRFVTLGDPFFDELCASRPWRARYRAALRVDSNQRLIVVSSTWGTRSAFGQHPQLLAELLAELPVDEYAVAAIFHPNTWVAHGSWQLRTWLRRSLDAGLRLIPHRGSWRASLVAADSVIGDNGSVTFYAAATGVPTILAAFDEEEVTPETPMAALGMRAPRWLRDFPARDQLDTVGYRFDPSRYGDLVDANFACVGHSLRRFQTTVYELLGIEPPTVEPRVRAVPQPDAEWTPPTAHLTIATRDGLWDGSAEPRVSIERFPAVLDPDHAASSPGRHIAVDEMEADHRLRESAGVFVRSAGGLTDSEPAAWVESMLHAYPGCRVAVAALSPTSFAVGARDGFKWTLSTDRPADAALIGSAVYAHLSTPAGDNDLLDSFELATGNSVISLWVTRRAESDERQAALRADHPLP